jgi:hypothetical protein
MSFCLLPYCLDPVQEESPVAATAMAAIWQGEQDWFFPAWEESRHELPVDAAGLLLLLDGGDLG